jgi:hypothetical protein
MRVLKIGLMAAIATTCVTKAEALVGPSKTGSALAPHVVMVLKRSKSGSGFCSGVAIGRDAVLTAAHCVTGAADLRVLPGPGGQADLMEIAAIATHPEFRPDAVRTRQRSIDLAIVRTKKPLPSGILATRLADASAIAVGSRFRIAGYGVAVEGDERTAGRLREGLLAARSPLSSILLWAQDATAKGGGACTGDSGGPIFAEDSTEVVAITAWATGEGKRQCGLLTQATLVAPQRQWIDGVLASWSAR